MWLYSKYKLLSSKVIMPKSQTQTSSLSKTKTQTPNKYLLCTYSTLRISWHIIYKVIKKE